MRPTASPKSNQGFRDRRARAALVFALLPLLGLLGACEKKPPPVEGPSQLLLAPVSYAELPGWAEDGQAEALPAFLRSCGRLARQPDQRAVGPQGLGGRVADWRPACAALALVPDGDHGAARTAIEAHFTPFRASDAGHEHDQDVGLLTGYYEAELNGAAFPGGPYQVPIYATPRDLVTVNLGRFRADLEGLRIVGRVEDGRLLPYHTRQEIDDGALGMGESELLWSDDPVDVFFLHIQGSGRVRMPDGSLRRIGFAASNGLDFTAIGRALLAEGKVPRNQASMQGIRAWLRANPAEAAEMMQRNARYIFFRWIEGEGPIGAQGVPLTAGRSLAVDPNFLPFGAPLYLDTTWPGSDKPLRRLVVAQDMGNAIKGPLRGDFFWGSGEAALEYAGRMKQKARFYLLLPNPVAERRKTTS